MSYPEFHYNDIFNLLSVIGHMAFAYIMVFFIVPRFIFPKNKEELLDKCVAYFVSMTILVIILGYILVILKLFELISIITVFIILGFRRHFIQKSVKSFDSLIDEINILVFDYFDGIIHPVKNIKHLIAKYTNNIKFSLKEHFRSINSIIISISLLVILIYSAFLRYLDALKHAAPAMSDAYITLSWIKYIERRMLFEGGIYPRGFHITLATLQKFASIDPFYILRIGGPLSGVLITVILYFTVSRFSGKKVPGLIAAFSYGILGQYLPTEWERQASTNSQEFAMIFVLPSIYFYYSFLKNGNRRDLYLGASGVFVMALVHLLPFGLAGAGMGVLIITALIYNFKKNFKAAVQIGITGVIAILIAGSQLVLGKLLGYETHSSSSEYLTNLSNNIALPQLKIFDYIALISLLFILLYITILIFKKKNFLLELFIFGFGTASFLLYYAVGYLTKLEMISNRSGDLWSLIIPVCIGFGWYSLFNTLLFYLKDRMVELVLCFSIIVGSILIFNPTPIKPYKMEFDADVEQYLRISQLFKHNPWILVSNPEEEMSIVLGSGAHERTEDFVRDFDPEEKQVGKWTKDIANNIFIYNEKKLYHNKVETSIVHDRKERAREQLIPWLEKYKASHDNWTVFYEDDNLQVIYIKIPETKEQRQEKVWDR